MNKISKLKDEDYQTILGVTKPTFDCMLKILEQAYTEQHKKGGIRLSKANAPVVVLIDVTECEIQRPKKKQKKYYSGKKKRHTIKTQVIANASTKDIICVSIAEGHKHDFKIFKESKIHFSKTTQVIVDKGYQGICNFHLNSIVPRKASKRHKLTDCEKLYNRLIARCRVKIENINSYIKRFRIFSGKYRNRRKKFLLRFSLICGVYNFQHT